MERCEKCNCDLKEGKTEEDHAKGGHDVADCMDKPAEGGTAGGDMGGMGGDDKSGGSAPGGGQAAM